MATRRRGAALEEAILDAGWAQLIDGGYGGFTFEAVAERAQTGKTVLYRRWSDKEALLMAVLERHSVSGRGMPDTGSLRGDVIQVLLEANVLGEEAPALFSTILGAYFDETRTTPAQLRARLIGDRVPATRRAVERAMERGEIPVRDYPPRVISVPFDLFRGELIMRFGPVPEDVIVAIVDEVFLPLIARD